MTLTKIGANLSGSANVISVTQSSHGFTVGKVLKSSGSNGTFATAQADSAANAEVVGIVTDSIDTNNFLMTIAGRITVDGVVPDVTAGTVLFLSATSAGDLTSTEPSTTGQISKPVAVVTTADSEMIMVNFRGEVIASSTESWDVNGSELILDVDGDTSLHANTDDQIDVQISGADDFRFTANSFNALSGSTLSIDSGATISNSGTLVGFNHNSFTVTQASHGLTVGKVVKSSGSNGAFATAQANSAANAEVVGIVTVVSGNDITIVTSGEVDIAGAVPDVAASTVVFLDPSNAGDLTATEPSTDGQISKPIGIVTTQNSKMVLLPFRGEILGSGVNNWDVNGLELVLDVDGDTTLHADTDDQIDVKISGADDFRFSANAFNVLSGSTLTIDSGATIANSGTATGFASNSFTNDVTITSGNLVIGTAGGGIDFSAQSSPAAGMASELLDHYEEGTFTPTLIDNSNTGGTYNGQVGRYQRIGNRCFFQLFLRTSNTSGLTGGDQAYITGLPFTSVNVSYAHAAINAGSYGSLGTGNAMCGDIVANSSKIRLHRVTGSAGALQMTINEWSSDGEAIISGHYEVA